MKFLDKIALNRLLAIITSFIIALLKLITPNSNLPSPKTPKKPLFPWVRKTLDKIKDRL